MSTTRIHTGYAICLSNDGYPASLEVRKVYRTRLDESAETHGLLRVIDESGEDYLYPESMFAEVSLPPEAQATFAADQRA